MRAAVVEEPGKLVVKDIPMPVMTEDEVLVKVQSASICNATDGHIFHGVFDGYHDFYPQILGHELAGEVVAVGSNVTELKVGDLVAQYTGKGAFCEYTTINPKEALWGRVSPKIPLRARSLVEMFHGAYVSTVYPAQICNHETVLVVGQGPMGQVAAAGAGLTAKKVIVTDLFPNRLEFSRRMGADVVLDRSKLSAQEVAQAVLDETDGRGADVVIMAISEDRSQNSDAYDMAIDAMRQGGRMTGLFVDAKGIGVNQRINPRQLLRKEATFCHTLHKIYGSFADELMAFQNAIDRVADGQIDLDCLITHEIGLGELEHALDLCRNHLQDVMKVVVYPDR